MPQVFHPSTNAIAKVSLLGSIVGTIFLIWVCFVYVRSSYGTDEGNLIVQPVPFSHEHHVGVLGIDCRYCHDTVEDSSFANFPPTKTCMNCHSQIWVGSSMLEPVRASYQNNEPLRWHRVYNLPGFVYFDHSIHVHKGVGCTTCHGHIDEMPFTYQVPSLLMEWCLDCHRNPEQALRPQKDVFELKWQPPPNQDEVGRQLARDYQIHDTRYMTSCTTCHR
jgi:hypothetical protein